MASNNPFSVEVHNLSVFYDQKPALWEVDFQLPVGKKIGILGPNGSGKSTLLKTIMGLLEPASGYTEILGKPVSRVRDKISYVPQRESVDWDFPITVREVVRMGRFQPRKLLGRLSKLDKEIADQALEQLKIMDLADRHISQLSGGQQQRVFLARSLAQRAEVYFMDEPFTGVDATTEKTIIEIINHLSSEGKTVIMVHHDLTTAPQYFDHLVMLNTRLITSGPTTAVFSQQNISEAFGGQLDILSEVSHHVVKSNLPVREDGHKHE